MFRALAMNSVEEKKFCDFWLLGKCMVKAAHAACAKWNKRVHVQSASVLVGTRWHPVYKTYSYQKLPASGNFSARNIGCGLRFRHSVEYDIARNRKCAESGRVRCKGQAERNSSLFSLSSGEMEKIFANRWIAEERTCAFRYTETWSELLCDSRSHARSYFWLDNWAWNFLINYDSDSYNKRYFVTPGFATHSLFATRTLRTRVTGCASHSASSSRDYSHAIIVSVTKLCTLSKISIKIKKKW